MKRAIIIPPEGEIRDVEMPDDLYQPLKDIIGGWLECPAIMRDELADLSIWVDEEGKLKTLPYNPRATLIANIPGDIIVGTVVITGPPDSEGETLGLTFEQIEKVRSVIG